MLMPPVNEHESHEDTWFMNAHAQKGGISLFPISNQHFPLNLCTWLSWPLVLKYAQPQSSREETDLNLLLQFPPLASSLINPSLLHIGCLSGWFCLASSIWAWNQLQNQHAVNWQGSNIHSWVTSFAVTIFCFVKFFLFPNVNSYLIFLFPWFLYQLSPHSNTKTNSPLNIVTNISYSVSLILFLGALLLGGLCSLLICVEFLVPWIP